VKRLTQKHHATIETEAATNPERYAALVALRVLQPELKALNLQIDHLKKKLKRLKKIDKNGYVRLDYRNKQLFDQFRFSYRNIF
jgi:hypothetical protein